VYISDLTSENSYFCVYLGAHRLNQVR